MPVEVTYLHNNCGVVITGFDMVKGTDLINAMKNIFSDKEKTRNYRYGLVDFSGSGKMDLSITQIIELSRIHIEASKLNSHIAVCFAIEKSFVYGLVRIWQVYAEHTKWKINITRSLDESRTWLSQELNLTF